MTMTECHEFEMSLKPCPFCSGAAERIDIPAEDDNTENAGASCIQCSRCGASTTLHFDRKENLVSSWNDRRLEPLVDEAIAVLKESRAVLAGILCAGHNLDALSPEEIEVAFWKADKTLQLLSNEGVAEERPDLRGTEQ